MLGVRAWRLLTSGRTGPLLFALTNRVRWPRGVMEARCALEPTACERPAGRDCVCGVYAFASAGHAGELMRPTTDVIGLVRAWGRVAVHRHGWRAEFVQPLWLATIAKRMETVCALGARYECDVVSVVNTKSALAAVARREQEMPRWPG